MELRYSKVESYIIKRRTFEGKINPDKNKSSLTSKYSVGSKYWIETKFKENEKTEAFTSTNCFRTKSDCYAYIERMKRHAGEIL